MSSSGAPPIDRFPAAADVPTIPGLVIRRLRRPSDYPRLNDIANEMREQIGQSFTTTVDQMAAYYDGADRFVPDRDVAVFELDGEVVGYGRTGVNEQPSVRVYEVVCFIDPAVDPTAIYPAMLVTLEAHARRLAADDPPGEKVIETFGGDDAPTLERFVLAAGFEPVRHGYTMVRPHVDDLPDSDLPAGLEIRPVQPEHRRAIWDAATEAFRDAWGFVEPTEAEYERYVTDPIESQIDLWRVAWDGDEVAGQVRSYINDVENERFGRLRGYTEAISVRRPWRRRGLARALIGASIVALRERGMTETALGVDTENVTGALHLYESCGYVPVSRSTIFHKPLG
jgi:mycothiol synthase